MSKKANPTAIGAFIVGAIIIITVLILLLSSKILFKKEIKVIMYFEGSVTGLNIGAPVKFRGVKIGTVTGIKLIVNKHTGVIEVPVEAEIDRSSYLIKLQDKTVKASEIFFDTSHMIENGLRAQLKLQSLLTGQLFIELEFDPDSSYKLRGDGTEKEIPTSITAMQEITQTLEKYPISKVLNNIASTMASIDRIMSDPVILETVKSINQTSKDYALLAKQLSTETAIISVNLKRTLTQAEKSFKQVDQSLTAVEKTLKTTDGVLREDSQLMNSLLDALNELASAARSVRTLADTLEQQPEAIIRGKSAGGN